MATRLKVIVAPLSQEKDLIRRQELEKLVTNKVLENPKYSHQKDRSSTRLRNRLRNI